MSFFVFYILATALILAQCEGILQEGSDAPHAYTDVADCSAHRSELRNNRMKASIRPRETLVTLKPGPGYNFNPSLVSVNRCDGFCPDRWSPSPTSITNKQFIVQLYQDGNPSPLKCVAVEVEEHRSCKCMCMQSAENCKPSQDWRPDSCSCQCKDRERLKRECTSQYGMEWYDDDCYCACTQKIMECQFGEKWAKEICGAPQQHYYVDKGEVVFKPPIYGQVRIEQQCMRNGGDEFEMRGYCIP